MPSKAPGVDTGDGDVTVSGLVSVIVPISVTIPVSVTMPASVAKPVSMPGSVAPGKAPAVGFGDGTVTMPASVIMLVGPGNGTRDTIPVSVEKDGGSVIVAALAVCVGPALSATAQIAGNKRNDFMALTAPNEVAAATAIGLSTGGHCAT